jgi:hypothetical protein
LTAMNIVLSSMYGIVWYSVVIAFLPPAARAARPARRRGPPASGRR